MLTVILWGPTQWLLAEARFLAVAPPPSTTSYREAQEEGRCPEPTLLAQALGAAVLASFSESHIEIPKEHMQS